ncbi:MAG: hypothetical protein KC636_03555 [Myxococcales bacterium]|nr:hypothetical protein [Myxococcales bacterium]
MRIHSILLAAALLLTPACAGAPVDVGAMQVTAPRSQGVAPSRLPLHIVLDPAAVPEQLTATASDGPSRTVYNVQSFVTRDLVATLSQFFASVDVVGPGYDQPGAVYVLAEVRVDAMALSTVGGNLRGRMDWSFVLRAAGRAQHIYQFQGTTMGPPVANGDAAEAFRLTLEAATAKIAESYVSRNISGRVANLEHSLPYGQ